MGADKRAEGHVCGAGCGPHRRGVLFGGAGAAAVAAAGPALARPGGRTSPWIDAHVHLQSLEWFAGNPFAAAPRGPRRRASPAPARGLSGVASSVEEASRSPRRSYGPGLADQTQRLLDEMDEAGIDVAILMAMDYDYTGEKLRVDHYRQLELLAGVRDQHPGRFILFAAVDPRRGASGVEMLRRAARELRIAGLGEFAPHFFGFAPNDRERCYPIYEACAELELQIAPNCSIVASHISRFCDPIYFEDVAHDFPTINVSLTSAGIPHWSETALALAQSKPNVFLDIGDWQARVTSDPVETVLRFVRRALDTDARHKIMFGSDYPVFSRTVSEKAWVEVFTVEARRRGIAFTDAELNLFFSDNAQEFLDLDVPMPPRRAGSPT